MEKIYIQHNWRKENHVYTCIIYLCIKKVTHNRLILTNGKFNNSMAGSTESGTLFRVPHILLCVRAEMAKFMLNERAHFETSCDSFVDNSDSYPALRGFVLWSFYAHMFDECRNMERFRFQAIHSIS